MRWSYRIILYLMGMMVLALGLTLSTKVNLGVSPIISLAYGASEITGISIGDATLILYSACILVQILIHIYMERKNKDGSLKRNILSDLLQFLVSMPFTRLMNLFASFLPSMTGPVILQITLLVLAIILVGIGAALSLDMRIVPNPGDGIVQAISDWSGIRLGLSKNILDISCVCMTCVFTYLLDRRIVGIGIGTVMAMIGTGRVIAVFNKIFEKHLDRIMN